MNPSAGPLISANDLSVTAVCRSRGICPRVPSHTPWALGWHRFHWRPGVEGRRVSYCPRLRAAPAARALPACLPTQPNPGKSCEGEGIYQEAPTPANAESLSSELVLGIRCAVPGGVCHGGGDGGWGAVGRHFPGNGSHTDWIWVLNLLPGKTEAF